MRRVLWILALFATFAAFCPPAPAQNGPAGIAVGSPLPTIRGTDLSGRPADLSRVAGVKTLVLSFWSIYCSDCVRELDDLRSMRGEFPVDEVEIVAVNTDGGISVGRIASFLKRYEGARGAPLAVTHLLDRDGSVVKNLGITQIPLLLTVDKAGIVTNVVGGYDSNLDRPRLLQAIQQGALSVGGWSGSMKGRLSTLLRETGPGGRSFETATYRIEESQGLFGWRDAAGWVADAAGRTDPEHEKKRVERLVAERLKLTLMRSALSTVGLQTPEPSRNVIDRGGIAIPESPFETDNRWSRLYRALAFDEAWRAESRAAMWIDDEYHGGLVASVDLDKLKDKLDRIGFTTQPVKVRLIPIADYDFKTRAVINELREKSWRFYTIVDDTVSWHGTAEELVMEINAIRISGLTIFAEAAEEGQTVRVEVY